MAFQQQHLNQGNHPGAIRAPFDPNHPVRVSAKKFEFDLNRKDWVCTPTTINVTRPAGYFDAGGMRVCFFVQEVEDDGCMTDSVAKFFKTDIPDVVHADYLNEAMAQCLSEEFAQNFNKLDTPKKISFLNCVVIVVEERDTPPLHMLPRNNFFSFRTQDTKRVVFCMEPKLNGEFTKYNSNFGDCYANNKRDAKKGTAPKTGLDSVFVSAEAFSHFTLQESGGSFLVCDLQGVEDLLTDPQIHTEEGKGLGMGNMGQEGIEKWVASHKCNEVCKHLGLKSYNEILNPPPPQHVIAAAQGGGQQQQQAPPSADPLQPVAGGHGSPQGGPPQPLPASAGASTGTNNGGVQKPNVPSPQPHSANNPPPPPGTWGSLYSTESEVAPVAPKPQQSSQTPQPPQPNTGVGQQPQHHQPSMAEHNSRSRYHDIRNTMYNTLPEGVQPSMRPSQRHLFQNKPQQPAQSGGGPAGGQPQPQAGQAFPGHQVQQPGQAKPGAPGTFLPSPQPTNPYGQNGAGHQPHLGYAPVHQQPMPGAQPGQQPMLYGGPLPGGQVQQGMTQYQQPQHQQQQQQPHYGTSPNGSPHSPQQPIQQGQVQQPHSGQQQQATPTAPSQQNQPRRDFAQMSEEEQLQMILERSKFDR